MRGPRITGTGSTSSTVGCPPLYSCAPAKKKIVLLKHLFEETYIKDVMNRNNLEDTDTLGDILNFLSSSIGSLTIPTKLSNTF